MKRTYLQDPYKALWLTGGTGPERGALPFSLIT